MSAETSCALREGPVLVTGATGFLGARVARALLLRGERVRLLHRPGRRAALEPAVPDGYRALAEPVDGDITDQASLLRAAKGCRAVIHVAAKVSRSGDPLDFAAVNVRALEGVLAAARAGGARRVVVTSSFFALGPSDSRTGDAAMVEGVSEDGLRRPAGQLDSYQHSKRLGALLLEQAALSGEPLVVLYPGALVGPGPLNEANFVTGMLRDHLRGRLVPLPMGGRQRWSFVHVDDAAAAHLRALDAGQPAPAYVIGGSNASLADVFAVVRELTGRALPRFSAPWPALWLAGLAEEIAERAFGRPPGRLTRGAARLLRHEWALDSSRARAEIGYDPRPLGAVVADTLAWLEGEGWVPRGLLRQVEAAPSPTRR